MTSIIAISDTHIGSQTGLCPPEVETDQEAGYKATPHQRMTYYRAWLPFVEQAVKQSAVLVLNGDLVDLDIKKRGNPQISHNPNDITRAAVGLFAPLIQAAKAVIITRGTTAHVGPAACHEEQLAAIINEKWPGKIVKQSETTLTHQHAMLDLEGERVDIAHHPEVGPGRAQVSQATYPKRLGVAIFNRYIEVGEKLPTMVIRSHFHLPADGDYHGIRVIALPGWQWPTEFVYRTGSADFVASFGGYMLDDLLVTRLRRKGVWLKL